MLVVAASVYAMAAKHEYNRCWRIKHVFSADRTITVGDSLYTLVGLFDRHRHTCTACLQRLVTFTSGIHRYLPCNGRNPSPDHDPSYKYRSPHNGICCGSHHYPTVYTRHNNAMLFFLHNQHRIRLLSEHNCRSYTACSLLLYD